MQTELFKRLAAGMVAGLAGTAVIQGLQAVGQKKMPEEMPPMKQHPGEYMVERAEEILPSETRNKIPESVEKSAAQLLGMGYGLTFGILFELLHHKKSNLLLEGTVLGLATWATGYLGWLPATGIMRPITRQKPGQVASAVLSHILYGISTAGTLKVLQRKGLSAS